jgi:hypothetical protein
MATEHAGFTAKKLAGTVLVFILEIIYNSLNDMHPGWLLDVPVMANVAQQSHTLERLVGRLLGHCVPRNDEKTGRQTQEYKKHLTE